MNHESAPIDVRERLAVEDPRPLLQKIVASEEIDEAVLFSTCNRMEIVALTRSIEGARMRLHSFLRDELAGGDLAADFNLEEWTYEHLDGEAVNHVFRVASALDSMVVGEPQILGQVKTAFRIAVECGACGPILNRLLQHGFATAKRVRSETRLGERPISVARVGVELAKQIFESFAEKHALLIGAGEMIEMALQTLQREGLASIAVANRTIERAAELASRFDATAHGLDELESLLADSDMVLTSIGGDAPILTMELVSAALKGRHKRPLFVIDIGVPRNADPAIDALDSVYRYDLDDMGAIASQNSELRQREAESANAIVIEEQQLFDGWMAALRVVPTIRHIRTRTEGIRTRELERMFAKTELDDKQRAAVDALTKSIVNKVLHAPISRLKSEAEREEGMAYLEIARVLFDLDRSDE
jgi:glutamyl-tRNA reductase